MMGGRNGVAVILAYGGGQRCAPLVAQLRQVPELKAKGRIVIVHNPSAPGERLGLEELDDGIKVVENDTNLGYAGGMNVGIACVRHFAPAWVLLLTHDVRITPSSVLTLVSSLEGAPGVAAVSPILVTPDGDVYSTGLVRAGRALIRHRTDLPPMASRKAPWPCDSLDGSAMLWRGSVLAELGGYQARFFMYFEDIELCTRATRAGWSVGVVGDARAVSEPGGAQRRAAHGYLRTRNRLQFAREDGALTFGLTVADVIRDVWSYTPKPGGARYRDPSIRKAARAYRQGVVRGAFDFVRGHWGPPPSAVLNNSDIASVMDGSLSTTR